MLVDLKELHKTDNSSGSYREDREGKPTYYLLALIAIAERLDRIGDYMSAIDDSLKSISEE